MAKAKHILQLSPEERQLFLNSFDFVISDCDGVLWKFSGPMEGAKEGLQAIQRQQKRLSYVSNNSFLSRQTYEQNFANLGVTFDFNQDLIQPATATVAYLRSINFNGIIYVMASDAFKEVLEAAGFECFSMPHTTQVTSLREIMAVIADAPKISAVVFDVDLNLNLAKFYAAQHFLATSPDCPLIYGAIDKTFLYNEREFAGVGLFMEALSSQVKQKAVVLGKPSVTLGELVVERFQIKDRSRVLFIGDTLKQDIGFANACGLQSLLVLSGATSREMLATHSITEEIPKYYADSVLDFVALLTGDGEKKGD